jgi:hypothetical protein
MKVLILGGYGVFGGRLARLLKDEPGLTLLIAGRSLTKAEAACARLRPEATAALQALALDRNGDLGLERLHPDIVVDASGPYQAYGERPYRVVEACLAARCHYLDLADGTDFVDGVSRFDDAAKAAGLVVLSGVSTCPVLTAGAVRALAGDIERIDTVAAGIAPSPYSGVGLNVVRAMTGYAGRPMSRGEGRAFLQTRKVTIAPPGWRPLRPRLFALVDTPDGAVLPRLFPTLRSVWFGAGPLPQPYLRLLIGLGWLVRLGLMSSAGFLAPLGHWMMNHLVWGEGRGGMFVEVEGQAGGRPVKRSWHLIAEADDGPFIPAMPAAALIRTWDQRRLAPGARDAAQALDLADYGPLFAERQIVTGIRREDSQAAPYPALLDTAYDRLPEPIAALHAAGESAWEGRASVQRGQSILARLAAALIGFPRAADDIPVRVDFTLDDGVETWTRTFAGQRFFSRQYAGRGHWRRFLIERFGPAEYAMSVLADETSLRLRMEGWSVLGIPLPRFLAPQVRARESADGGRFNFDVEIRHWATGLIVHYRGWLERVGSAAEPPARAAAEAGA